MTVPQANDIAKIIDIPLAVANGSYTIKAVSKRYSFDQRQGMYYVEAAEMLGLIARGKRRLHLTAIGQRYVALDYPDKRELLTRNMLSLPIIASILVELLISHDHRVSRKKLQELASVGARISGTTVDRRVQTLLKWFEWLGKETGAFRTTKDALVLGSHH